MSISCSDEVALLPFAAPPLVMEGRSSASNHGGDSSAAHHNSSTRSRADTPNMSKSERDAKRARHALKKARLQQDNMKVESVTPKTTASTLIDPNTLVTTTRNFGDNSLFFCPGPEVL